MSSKDKITTLWIAIIGIMVIIFIFWLVTLGKDFSLVKRERKPVNTEQLKKDLEDILQTFEQAKYLFRKKGE